MLPNFTNKKPDKEPNTVSSPMTSSSIPNQARSVTRSGDRSAPSVIGADLMIIGNLVSKGEVQVDGEVQGDLQGNHVVVGERAKITGSIISDEVVVHGHVMGSVRGKKVILQSSSRVEGDIYHETLAIEQGAFFEGNSRRSNEPTAGVSRLELPMITGMGSLPTS